jgi:malonate-semialdehyde dehydrogenase (acetylating)/methylmalonate-semialdehyde dehydrogenase
MNNSIELRNYIAGAWRQPRSGHSAPVINPATAEPVASVPMSSHADVDDAVAAARAAFPAWRRTPPGERIQYLFALKQLLDANIRDLATAITQECGKTLGEADGELRRGIENVEVACGIPSLMMGANVEDIARGIDEIMIRQPVGVVAIITPFNFPGMIPLWFLPYAIACGNCAIVKPSEKTPVTMARVFELLEAIKLPAGVVNLLHGGRESVDALLDHPGVRAVSFVGSSAVARHVYSRAAASGKRVQCQGGAKNPSVILPDADMEMTTKIVADSAFGCAGQRCLATSVAIIVGDANRTFPEMISDAAASRRVGNGLEAGVEMGPVITAESRQRIQGLLATATRGGVTLRVGGAEAKVPPVGNFVAPTVLDHVESGSEIAGTEIFGPVLSLMRAQTVDEAIEYVNRSAYGNMACLFTRDGLSARKFRYEAEVGNVGINVGVAAPMAFFPFSGWKESFFGDLHAQGRDAIDFYTEKKVVVERWPADWTRKF